MLDKVGKEIPRRLEAVFKRGMLEFYATCFMNRFQDIRNLIRDKDELFIGIHKPTFDAICSDMQNILKAEIPYAVCPFCDAAGCKACLGRGWLGKFKYDATASARKD